MMNKIYEEDSISKQLYLLNKEKCLLASYLTSGYNSKLLRLTRLVNKIISELHLRFRPSLFDKKISEISEYVGLDSCVYSGELPKVIVYTCITGKYDNFSEPLYKSPNCHYVAITDNQVDKQSNWEIISIDRYADCIPAGLNNLQINRWIKMHPHLLFPEYDYSIYVDGNVTIVTDIMPIILRQHMGNKFLGIHLHYCREKIKSEANALLSCGKVNYKSKKKMMEQIESYYKKGYDDSVKLLEATIIVRKHNNERCIKIMEDWWTEFISGIQRDQLSLPYVLWNNDVCMNDIYLLGDNEYANPRFFIVNHLNNKR
ncbi:glycosyltransferase domain-containing protein [Selenomonas ruminantium]|nr:glycosyltransferase domain-containing protein [Selenomonas ruminantium]